MIRHDDDDDAPQFPRDALCPQVDPELFFPEKGGPTADAKMICGRCEVKAQCLQFALDNNEKHGIWGGTSEGERRVLKHQA